MRIELGAEGPTLGGRAVVLVGRVWTPCDSRQRARSQARAWAEEGWRAILVSDDEAGDAIDAARRAGLAVVLEGRPAPGTGALALAEFAPMVAVRAADWREAFGGLFAGASVIVGPLQAVVGCRALVALVRDPAGCGPAERRGQWTVRVGADEAVAWTDSGGDLTCALPEADEAWSIHWLDPLSGAVLGVTTPEPSNDHVIRLPEGEAAAIYLGPVRLEEEPSQLVSFPA